MRALDLSHWEEPETWKPRKVKEKPIPKYKPAKREDLGPAVLSRRTKKGKIAPYPPAKSTWVKHVTICPYCDVEADLVDGADVYGPNYRGMPMYVCANRSNPERQCRARVGCHPGTARPLGTPADAQLRSLRTQCHAEFDPLWQTGEMTRTQAYMRLAQYLGIPDERAHIGMLTVDECKKLLRGLWKRRRMNELSS